VCIVKSDPSKPLQISQALHEKIARRAFELYEARGRQGGRELQDWLQAEAEVLQEEILPKASVAAAVYED
jgi:hypothetical protein